MADTLAFDGENRQWVVVARPHVVVKLKRLFTKLSKASHGEHRLADTRETARDLAWFMERYPLETTSETLAHLERRSAEHKAQEKLVFDTIEGHVPPPPFELALPLRDYQTKAVALALRTGALLLADEMGLGKTPMAIGMFARPEALPALVVTETALPKQWAAEINRFAPNLRVHILAKATPYDLKFGPRGRPCKRHRFVADPSAGVFGIRCDICKLTRDDVYQGRAHAMPDVIISNYTKMSGWGDYFGDESLGLKSLVFDEAQQLRHDGSGKYEAARHIRKGVKYCLAITGTPIYNQGIEFHTLLEVVAPDALGTREEFVREWCREGSGFTGGEQIVETRAFGTYLRENGLMLRRTRSDVGRELPKQQNVLHPVESDEKALDDVESACAELAKIILSQGERLEKGAQFRAAEEFSNKLRQATGIAKAAFVAEFVRMLITGGEELEPVILFGWHHCVYDIWKERLADLNPVMFTGAESTKQKLEAKDKFVRGESKLLIMSLRAGAGIDGLQHVCANVVYGEFDYSPGVHAQCTARVHRDGQQRPVFAYYPYTESGSDPVILDILGVKQQQLTGVIDPTRDLVEELVVDVDRVKKLAAHYLTKRTLPKGGHT